MGAYIKKSVYKKKYNKIIYFHRNKGHGNIHPPPLPIEIKWPLNQCN